MLRIHPWSGVLMPQSADRTREGDTVSLTPAKQLQTLRFERNRKPRFAVSPSASKPAWTVRCWSERKVSVDRSPDRGQPGPARAGAVLGRCRAAARDAGLSDEEIAAFMDEAMAGDYDHLLQTAMRWFEIR